MYLIKKDSYWYIDTNSKTIMAMCIDCHKKHNVGWLWMASNGYGDYDLNCSKCNEIIYQRETNENKASV